MRLKRVVKDAIWGWRYQEDPWYQEEITWWDYAWPLVVGAAGLGLGILLQWLI